LPNHDIEKIVFYLRLVSISSTFFARAFHTNFWQPSYVWAWCQKFVQKMRAKNVDEIDTFCLSLSDLLFRNLIFFICNRDLRILEMFQKTKANKHRYEWGLSNKKLHYWGVNKVSVTWTFYAFLNTFLMLMFLDIVSSQMRHISLKTSF